KLSWTTETTVRMLAIHAGRRNADVFARVTRHLLLALQCADDALDAVEDRQIFQTDVPTIVGLSPAALISGASHLFWQAARIARTSDFHQLADWLIDHSDVVGRLASHTQVDRVETELSGMILAAELGGP